MLEDTEIDASGQPLSRREFSKRSALGIVGLCGAAASAAKATPTEPTPAKTFQLKYILASCMYGYADLVKILPEVQKVGATAIDLWPKVHGNQREQLDALGVERYLELTRQADVKTGCLTQYKLGPFGLREELRLARRLGCETIVTGGKGPKGLKGQELKSAVAKFVEAMKPHLAVAEENGVTIAIENHGNNLIESPDSLKWLQELRPSQNLGIAFAPYHLPQDPKMLGQLVEDLGESLSMFYAWQHGMGCMEKLPKEQELLQMPGRGPLDFGPMLAALKSIDYKGWTEIFMHPVPRGVPILASVDDVTKEINRSRSWIQKRIDELT